jgi:hypothetical protein
MVIEFTILENLFLLKKLKIKINNKRYTSTCTGWKIDNSILESE